MLWVVLLCLCDMGNYLRKCYGYDWYCGVVWIWVVWIGVVDWLFCVCGWFVFDCCVGFDVVLVYVVGWFWLWCIVCCVGDCCVGCEVCDCGWLGLWIWYL